MKSKTYIIKPVCMALILIFTSLFGIAVNAQEVQFSQIEFNAFEDLTIDTDNLTGFNTQNEAEDTLLEKYNSVKVKGSEKTVPIISWAIEENPASYDVKKPGKYTFIASLDSNFEMEFSDQTIIYPKINIIIKQAETPKITITKFSDFSNIQLNSTETDGFATLNEAKSSLLKKYSTVKVNGSQDELQISSWSFDEKVREYTPTKEGTYTFIASIADSEKYDTSKLNISLPKIKIVVTAPKGNAKITVRNDNNEKISDADIIISNQDNSYYGATDKFGECIINNIKFGSYKVIIACNNKSFTQNVIINNQNTVNIKCIIETEKAITTTETTSATTTTKTETEKTTTTKKPAETTSAIDYVQELTNNKNEPIEITTLESSNGLMVGISIDKLSDAQQAEIRNMSADEIYSEIQKAVDAVSTVNFIETTDDAKQELANETKGEYVRTIPVNFTLHAKFAFPVKVSITAGKGIYPVGNDYSLYYYNPETKQLEETGKASVDENGIVTFVISHCSDYFILDKKIAANNSSESINTTISETSVFSAETKADIEGTPILQPNAVNSDVAVNNEKAVMAQMKNETVTTPAETTQATTTQITDTKESARKAFGKKLIIFGFVLTISCSWLLSKRNKVKRLHNDIDDED